MRRRWLLALLCSGLAFVPSRRSEAPLRRSRLALCARKRSQDLLSGETFSRKAVFLLETEQPGLQTLIFGSAFVAVTSFFGLVYNGLGQLALLTSAGAKPGLDEPTVLFGEAVLVLLSAFGFSTLSRARTERLRRMDAELRFSALPLKLTDGTGLERRLSELASKRRVVVLFAPTEEELQESLTLAKAYRRRWETSQALVVAVGPAGNSFGGKWLAIAQRPEVWEQCYGALQAATGREPVDEASWLLFGKSGRLRGESTGRDFDQVLAFIGVTQDLSLLPQLCGEAEEDILKVHDTFYEALKGGDAEIMKTLWVEDAGGDNDPRPRVSWSSVLSDKAAVLDVVDVDVVRASENLALVTSIEVCLGEGGLFNDGGPSGKGTLLATKRLSRTDASSPWRIESHQTIPYCNNTVAFQSLVCNCRGCVLLKRT
ncbi:unnamed protein product [Effrenium voratum]|nr:unnamed protein product [Effrenium voratum]